MNPELQGEHRSAETILPIWYLDVDGVINICMPKDMISHVPPEFLRTKKVNNSHGKGTWTISWDTRVVEFLNLVRREAWAEIVWLTTWEHEAASQLAPALELDEFRVPSRSMRLMPESARGWWKWESVKHHADEDQHDHRAIVWTDDDISYSVRDNPAILQWQQSRRDHGLRTLMVSPRTHRGLTMDHLGEIRKLLGGPKES